MRQVAHLFGTLQGARQAPLVLRLLKRLQVRNLNSEDAEVRLKAGGSCCFSVALPKNIWKCV